MSHHLATQVLRVEEFSAARERESERNAYGLYSRRRSTVGRTMTERVATAAIDSWVSGSDGFDITDVTQGEDVLKPMVPEELLGYVMDEVNTQVTIVVPLMRKEDYKVMTKDTVISLTGDEWNDYTTSDFRTRPQIICEKIEQALPHLKGSISGYEIEGSKRPGCGTVSDGWTIRSTVDVDAGGGKAVTVYHLKAVYFGRPGHPEFSAEGYETQALARAEAVKMMKEDDTIKMVDVVPSVKREDGTNVVKVRRKVTKATATVKVSYVKVTAKEPQHDRWIVGFDVHD